MILKPATIWARDFNKAQALAEQLKHKLGIEVIACESVADATQDADIIVSTTPSNKPILRQSDIKPGQHITAMGSDSEHKNEIDATIIGNGISYFCDRLSQCAALGELHHAIEQGLIAPSSSFPELGNVISEQNAGRKKQK